MNGIKPIETIFDGHRFRSRLEARWAVFFKKYEITYEYEIEGFKLPSGLQYLPDFFLPDLDVFVEVKFQKHLSKKEISKICGFAHEGDKRLLLIAGTPTNEKMYLIDRKHMLPLYEFESYEIGTDEAFCSEFFEALEDATVEFSPLPLNNFKSKTLIYKTLPPYDDHSRMTALLAAKQARFEFGEGR